MGPHIFWKICPTKRFRSTPLTMSQFQEMTGPTVGTRFNRPRTKPGVSTLPETNSSPLEMDEVGIRSFPIGFRPIFRGVLVSFREGNSLIPRNLPA